jgi:hypothetical protein
MYNYKKLFQNTNYSVTINTLFKDYIDCESRLNDILAYYVGVYSASKRSTLIGIILIIIAAFIDYFYY